MARTAPRPAGPEGPAAGPEGPAAAAYGPGTCAAQLGQLIQLDKGGKHETRGKFPDSNLRQFGEVTDSSHRAKGSIPPGVDTPPLSCPA